MNNLFNVSSLFNSLNKNTGSIINFSDYNSIRSGSYKKLLKSYYAMDNEKEVKKTSNSKDKIKANTDKTGLTKMKNESDELNKSTKAVMDDSLWKQTNGSYDMDKIASAIKKFADDYNDVISQSSKVDNKDVKQYVGWMGSMTSTMSNALSKVGVTTDKDGKLSVDSDAVKKADIKNLKALFKGSSSYASQIEQKASSISSAALRNNSLYSSNGTLASTLQSSFTGWM